MTTLATATATAAPPMRYPKLAQPWIALALAILAQIGIAFFVLNVVAIPLIAVWVGIPLLLAFVPATRWFANCHRTMLAGFIGEAIPRPYKKPPLPGILMWLRTTLSDPATWRDIVWLLVNAVVGFTLSLISAVLFLSTLFYGIYPLLVGVTPEGVFTEPFGGLFTVNFWTSFLVMPVALIGFMIWQAAGERLLKANAYIARSLLGPTESAKLALRVQELATSRAETVDTQAAELRRIERDLHDGAQARLAALSMNLGMAEEMVARDPAQAAALLTEARLSASTALSELRDLVRGIHPPVLADRGLDGAVRALAMSCPFKVDVMYDVPGRPPAPVESAAYFAVAECLANAVKYSAATTAWIQITHEHEKLHMIVGDDGVGGAVVRPGGGLYGIERRLAAFDGTLTVVSPSAGPTTVIMELPCESSSLKTTPSSGTA
ncbi:sensor histidine kinase [Kribbella sp. NPDC058245]|uniref:sensor histidine kinase n=1 Tax=Kribbella sp. NPDC058245 TaxID=3346399 RepID=UPI0036E5EF7A